jgi:ketosteroid isomerase-like protein
MHSRDKIRAAAVVLMIAVGAMDAAAQNSNVRADNNRPAVEAVRKLEVDLCGMLVRGEWDTYAANLTDDYVRILPGKMQRKSEVLAEFRTSKTKTISMVPEEIDVRVYGNTAVTIIHLRTRLQDGDGKITEQAGVPTKVFVRRNGRWYLAQLSGMPLK